MRSIQSATEATDVLDKNYQSLYKPLAKFLFAHPEFSFSFSFTGNQLLFFKKKHTEFISVLKDLIERNQIEIFGTGFYEPILPLLYPIDRTGQIDLMSTEIRRILGRRPRGFSLFADCWDLSLVSSLCSCGIEYTFLDSDSIHQEQKNFLPLTMTELGKTIEIYPIYDECIPKSNLPPSLYLEHIFKLVQKAEKKDSFVQLDLDRIITVNLFHEDIMPLIEGGWFESFSEALSSLQENNCSMQITTSTVERFRKKNVVKIPSFIPSSLNKRVLSLLPHISEKEAKNIFSVNECIECSLQSQKLLNRISYMSTLINQVKNDKMRKMSARETLWKAQNGISLLPVNEASVLPRQTAYKYLMEADKILRDTQDFKESVSCFDYNNDGTNEFVCRMQHYFACITLSGGSIQEFELLKNTGNYADNFSRKKEYDLFDDGYERGLFVDHLFNAAQFASYIKGEPAGNGIFSRIRYSVLKYVHKHSEVQLYARAITPSNQKIYLRKKYVINSGGMNVQYILRNESDKTLSAVFASESNFAHTSFNKKHITYFMTEAVDNNEIIHLEPSETSSDLFKSGKLMNVQAVSITDGENGIHFGLEPNETSGFCYIPIILKRPSSDDNSIEPVQMTFVETLFWDLTIEPGKEIEKTINFTFRSVRKQKKS